MHCCSVDAKFSTAMPRGKWSYSDLVAADRWRIVAEPGTLWSLSPSPSQELRFWWWWGAWLQHKKKRPKSTVSWCLWILILQLCFPLTCTCFLLAWRPSLDDGGPSPSQTSKSWADKVSIIIEMSHTVRSQLSWVQKSTLTDTILEMESLENKKTRFTLFCNFTLGE